MAIDKEIKAVLNDHEKRINHIESLLSKPKTPIQNKSNRKLTDYLMELRSKGFFSQPKIVDETHAKLQKIYSCEHNRVAVALLRLSQHKQLRRASKIVDGKKYQAYVW
jgi:hypothetical protein